MYNKSNGATKIKGNKTDLTGEKIPLVARILHVLDYYVEYLYLNRGTKEELINYLTEEAGHKFDPCLVTEFIDIIK
mgnify:CR=1 FL=1